jgi:hypothetical protein
MGADESTNAPWKISTAIRPRRRALAVVRTVFRSRENLVVKLALGP